MRVTCAYILIIQCICTVHSNTDTNTHTSTNIRSGNDSFLLHFCSSKFPFLCVVYFVIGFLCVFFSWLIRYCSCLRVLLSVFVVSLKCVLLLYIPSFKLAFKCIYEDKIYWTYSLAISLTSCFCYCLFSLYISYKYVWFSFEALFHLGYLVHLQ